MTRRKTLLASLLAVVVLAAFAPGLDNDFSGDDLEWVRFGLRIVREPSLVLSLFSGFVTPTMNVTVGADALIAGTTPWPWNLTGLLFHILNVVLLYLLLDAGPRVPSERAAPSHPALPAVAWWTAAWWGLHYRHDEAVFWLGGRPHVLVMSGILLALLAQRRWLEGRGRLWLAACLVAGEAAILSKESGVMVLPIAAAYVALFTREGISRAAPRRWAGPAGLGALVAIHAGVLFLVRGQHQFYYRLDMSWLARLAASHLEAVGLPVGDPPSAWLALPAAIAWGLLWWKGAPLLRFGLVVMLLGTLPTMLIEFQPPRYRYFPLAGAAIVLAALLTSAGARWKMSVPLALTGLAIACLYLASGVRNDEVFLDRSGRIHRSVRDAFCAAADGTDASLPLAVVWRPSQGAVRALQAALDRDVAWGPRNYPPIYVRASGIEGVAEVETLAALCVGRAGAAATRRLSPLDAARVVAGSAFTLIAYEPGGFTRGDAPTRAALREAASGEKVAGMLPDGRRWAVLETGLSRGRAAPGPP